MGLPATAASKIANLDVTPPDAVLYSFETNAVLYDGVTTAPARRVQTFFQSGFAQLNANGLKLFDAGMAWILGRSRWGVLRRWRSLPLWRARISSGEHPT